MEAVSKVASVTDAKAAAATKVALNWDKAVSQVAEGVTASELKKSQGDFGVTIEYSEKTLLKCAINDNVARVSVNNEKGTMTVSFRNEFVLDTMSQLYSVNVSDWLHSNKKDILKVMAANFVIRKQLKDTQHIFFDAL